MHLLNSWQVHCFCLAEYLNGFAADHKKSVSVTEIKDVTDTLFWCVCFVRMLPDWRILRYAAHDENNQFKVGDIVRIAVFLAEIIVFFRKCLVGYDGVQFFHWRIGHK